MTKNKKTVCAVVVTYNRKNLLVECLAALRRQTRPVDAIYIIDNASTDGTPELLFKEGYIKELPPENLSEPREKDFEVKNLTNGESIKVHYVRMHENTGGAGGFHEGVKRAYERGYDWLWLMDDDVEPVNNALQILFQHTNYSKFIHARKQYLDGQIFEFEGYLCLQTGEWIKFGDISFKKGDKEIVYINYGCFEGAFIHRSIVTKIGFPNKDFFIGFDDTLYGLLASFYTHVSYIKPILFKKKVKPTRISNTALYYSIRNKFLFFKILQKKIFLFRTRKAYLKYSIFLLRVLIGILIHDRSLSRVRIFFKSIIDGLRYKSGKCFF